MLFLCVLHGFVHVTIFDCLNSRVNTSVFCRDQDKTSVLKMQNMLYFKGFGAVRKKVRKQHFSTRKLFTVFRASHVFWKVQKHCEYQSIFCDQIAKNAVIYINLQGFFCCACKTLVFAWYLQCFVYL